VKTEQMTSNLWFGKLPSRVFIAVPHGRLEAIIKEPPPTRSRHGGVALVLHPHPLYGGTMHNKVVYRAAAALNDAGLAVLRINFRGAGQSTGTHDEARGEREDARAGLAYLAEHYPGEEIVLAGFSFGARVGLEVGASDDRVVRLIGIGTPVNMYDFEFLKACRKPLLLVHGEHDEYGSLRGLRELVAGFQPDANVQLRVIQGTGHFFEGRLDEMKKAITEWITMQESQTRLVSA
jgi:alpha/beta superfamily hydrolase